MKALNLIIHIRALSIKTQIMVQLSCTMIQYLSTFHYFWCKDYNFACYLLSNLSYISGSKNNFISSETFYVLERFYTLNNQHKLLFFYKGRKRSSRIPKPCCRFPRGFWSGKVQCQTSEKTCCQRTQSRRLVKILAWSQ